ncbi:MAG: lysoplasmalogenase [Rhodobacteraceae bacterium]|nr:lysoplasmalogenase [Paracoccaceae bacterium]
MFSVFGLLLLVAPLAALIYLIGFAARAEGRHSWTGTCMKTLSTAALALTGLSGGAPGLITLGLALGAMGDFALSRPGKPAFLAGMGAFAAGHLAYALAFWQRGAVLGGPDLGPGPVVALAVLVLLLISTEFWLAPRTGALRGPVRGYGLVIGVMAASVALLPANPGDTPLTLGAALFLASDVLLALRLFVATAPTTQGALSLALWPAYWLGQVLILFGAALYWTFPKG